MDHEIDTNICSRELLHRKSQMYSQNVTFRVEISGNHRFLGQPHAELEVEGLKAPGKGLTGPKTP
jgi:hypothetical protein